MCDDHALGVQPPSEPERTTGLSTTGLSTTGLSRRDFTRGAAAVVAAVAFFREVPRLPLHSPARAATADGTNAYSMAMHIHSSFSEQSGSMDAQLFQATANSVDVLWWTDHDARLDGLDFRDVVHFTSLTGEQGGPGQGGAWIWKRVESGPLASGSGGIATSPSSPNDPVAGGSLHLKAQSSSASPAAFGYYANCRPAGWNYRDNLTGQSLSIDVLLDNGWSNGYLELLINTSYHQASGGRPAGAYSLSYRVAPSAAAGRQAQGNQGVITIPAVADGQTWTTVTVTPADDIAALWPDLDYRDFALFELTLNAVSTGDPVSGYFDYLRFNRSISGEAFLQQQADMGARLASSYPSVVQQQGLEVSWRLPHLNWFGGGVTVPTYSGVKNSTYLHYLWGTVVPQIHSGGGLVSYNHPFGYTQIPILPPAQQDQLVSQVAASLLPSGPAPAVLGCDLIEAGYHGRAGVDLAHHVALWDIMSRNAIFLTGNGTSDDHFGVNWHGQYNNWITWVWANSTTQNDLLAALAAGRSWCGSLSGFRGTLDMLVDGTCPMGSVSVSPVTSRQLTVTATSLVSRGSLQVLQGAVDYAGSNGLSANTQVIASYPAGSLSGITATLPIDTHADSFVRAQILNSNGAVVGLSNPVWLLRNPPPGGIPASRAC